MMTNPRTNYQKTTVLAFSLHASSADHSLPGGSGFLCRLVPAWLCGTFVLASSAGLWAQTFTVIYTCSGPSAPSFGKLLSSGNTLYCIGSGAYGNGSVFRVNTDGRGYSTLKSFSPAHASTNGVLTNSDGVAPLAGVVLGGDTLYGTTYEGGAWGMGTVFSLNTNGTGLTVLRHFSGGDGKAPYAELLLVSNILYGTTAAGGASNRGAIFQLNTDGSGFNLLKSFAGTDGLLPLGGLTFSDGVIYGTTYQGGASNHGTVFSIHADGTSFKLLKEFTGQDGSNPRYNLVVSGTSIYGTTEGGSDLSQSLVYQLSTDGTYYRILKTFSALDPGSGTNDDGYLVRSGLAASGGALFGTTSEGGNYASGVVFALRMDGSAYTVLRHFSISADNSDGVLTNNDGAQPLPSLVLSEGTLYGTTQAGGGAGQGTVFGLSIAPQIQPDPISAATATNGFALNITGYSNQIITVESSSNLRTPGWQPLQTNTLGAGPVHFADLNWTNHPQRFYRVRAQ